MKMLNNNISLGLISHRKIQNIIFQLKFLVSLIFNSTAKRITRIYKEIIILLIEFLTHKHHNVLLDS